MIRRFLRKIISALTNFLALAPVSLHTPQHNLGFRGNRLPVFFVIETPELMSTPAVINRTREEGIIIIIRRGECRSAVCSERMPDAERTQHRNQCQELVSEFLSMTVSL